MSTDYPYSQQWRERTRERIEALQAQSRPTWNASMVELSHLLGAALHWDGSLTLERTGPVDEMLDRLEEECEAEALRECVVHHQGVGSPRVRRVEGVSLDALLDCEIKFEPNT